MSNGKFTGYHDINGNPIYVGMICYDEDTKVDDIEIMDWDGKFYALPVGLDAEPLELVWHSLRIKTR